jgi:hypothetical protein
MIGLLAKKYSMSLVNQTSCNAIGFFVFSSKSRKIIPALRVYIEKLRACNRNAAYSRPRSLQYSDGLDTEHPGMSATTQLIFGKVPVSLITIHLFAPSGRPAERGLERVRIAVSSKSLKTVLDQQGKPDLPLDRLVDVSIEEVLRERR